MSATKDPRQRQWEAAYRHRRRNGIPARRPVMERFWERVDRGGPVPEHRPDLGPCWVWRGWVHPSGYGRVYADGRAYQAHRFAYEREVGRIPTGLEPDHLCRNKACVNPSHLEPVTHQVNCIRGPRGRATGAAL